MKLYEKDFSIIVPHRNTVQLLPKLLSTIPQSDRIEVLIVDNSIEPIRASDVASDYPFVLVYSEPSRYAGGARNVGIDIARGKWLIFADADDYFSPKAFDVFYQYLDSSAEIIYSCMGGIYIDTGEHSDRGDGYTSLVRGYIQGEKSEEALRLSFSSPCCKMVSHDLVTRYNIRYDEILAGNDIYFSIVSGFYAKEIMADANITYIATVSRGSLTRRRDFDVIKARLYSVLHCNQFLKSKGLKNRQLSVMFSLAESFNYGPKQFFCFLKMIIRFRQNPFIGWQHWLVAFRKNRQSDKRESRYIVK